MNSKARLSLLACAIALSACDDDSGPAGNGTTGDMTTTDEVATTIPVTSVTETSTDPTTAGSSSSTSGTDTDTDTDTTTTSSSGSGSEGSSSTGSTSGSTSTGEATTGDPTWEVEWCNLQFPPMIEGTTATVTTAYARVYVEGLTDQTPSNDVDAQLQVEFGYGADGSDPAVDGWDWVSGSGNVGWNGNDAGQPNNDEYQGDLQFAAAGTFDYAARVSGDGGDTWVHCDLDGLVEGGYTSEQAGNAVIQ